MTTVWSLPGHAAGHAMAFGAAFLATLVLTPPVRALNKRLGMIDRPDPRRINKTPIPRGGGLALVLGLFASYTVFCALEGISPLGTAFSGSGEGAYWRFSALAAAMAAIGLADDKFGMDARLKLLGQVAVAFFAWSWLGVGFRAMWPSLPAALDCFFTVFWIVGAVNAFNLIDGLDGLASGLALIATLGLAGVLILDGKAEDAIFHFAFIGALLGFLRYNFNPASVFLGDCGSMFIGFTLAVMTLAHQKPDSVLVSIGVPLLAMGVPIFDTFLAICRRSLRRVLQKRMGEKGNGRVMAPDADHLHHRILRSVGMDQRKAVSILYAAAALAVATGLVAVVLRSRAGGLWLVALALGSFVVFKDMARIELFDAGRLLGSLARDSAVKARRRRARLVVPFSVAGDAFMLAAVFFACVWTTGAPVTRDLLRIEFPLRTASVFAALVAVGTYRTIWSRAMLSNFARLALACAAGGIVSSAAIYYSPADSANLARFTFLYVPLSFVAVSAPRVARALVRDLLYSFDRARLMSGGSGEEVSRILVYGAGLRYRSFRRELVRSAAANHRFIVGLIDDDITLKGKRIGGIEVLGTLGEAPEIVRKTKADAVVVACDMRGDWFDIVRQTLEPLGIKTTHFGFFEKPAW